MITDRNEALVYGWSHGLDYPFPSPWFHAQCFGGYELLPISTCAELYAESLNMRHCAGLSARHIAEGHLCAISVRQRGARVATALVGLTPAGRRDIGEKSRVVRGYRGALVPEIDAIIGAWLHEP